MCEWRLVAQGSRLQSLQDIHGLWASKLHIAVDEGGLKESARKPGRHRWVTDDTKFLSGWDFINSCRIRISALAT